MLDGSDGTAHRARTGTEFFKHHLAISREIALVISARDKKRNGQFAADRNEGLSASTNYFKTDFRFPPLHEYSWRINFRGHRSRYTAWRSACTLITEFDAVGELRAAN